MSEITQPLDRATHFSHIQQEHDSLLLEFELSGDIQPFPQNLLANITNLLKSARISITPSMDVQERRVIQSIIDFWATVLYRIDQKITIDRFAGASLPHIPCPYRGLEAFEAEHAANYFGRDAMIAKLVEKIRETNFVAVVGPSGSGKSSLVRAGLVTALKHAGALPGSREWVIAIIRPLDNPLLSFAKLCVDQLSSDLSPTKRLEEIRSLTDGLQAGKIPIGDVLAALRQKPGYPQRLVVIIDQFEETFTLGGDSEEAKTARRTFLNTLLNASETEWLTIILTLRADFYGHILAEEHFGKRVDAGLVNVLPMTMEERKAAIEKPALAAGRHFEDGLVARILDDLNHEAGELPLLEFALTELWERATAAGLLTHAAYEEIGEVAGAIAKRAEETLQSMKPDEQQIVRRIFTRLVRVTRPEENAEDTKRRIALNELEPGYHRLVKELADARLLVTGRDEQSGSETIEVAHEALIRNWRESQSWLNSDREFLLWRQRLRPQVSGWANSGKKEDYLLRGAPLNESEGWSNAPNRDLSDQEREYIAASRQQVDGEAKTEEERRKRELQLIEARAEAERQRAETQAQANRSLRRRALWLAGALVIALLAAGTAFSFFNQANSARQAEVRARQTVEAGSVALATEVAVRTLAEGNAKQAADNEAAQRSQAEQQSRLAQARYLANQAAFYRKNDPQLALLLAREAISSTDAIDGYTTVEANAALRGLLQPMYNPRHTVGHTAAVTSVAFSPDGKTLASASDDKSVILWELGSSKPLATLKGHTNAVLSVAFSPDGKTLASASEDHSVILWELSSGKLLATLDGHTAAVNSVAFSPDGRSLTSASDDRAVILWDVRSRKPLATLNGHTAAVTSVAFSPDGRILASASADNSIILWEVSSGKLIATLNGHAAAVTAVAFSPNGKTLASASWDKSVILWELSSGKPLATLKGHTNIVTSVAFSPNGKTLASASWDKSVILWDVSSGKPLATLKGHTNAVLSVAFSPDGKTLASASEDHSVILWEGSEPDRVDLDGHQGPAWHALFGPQGDRVASAGQDGIVHLWNASNGAVEAQLAGHGSITKTNSDCPMCIQTISFDPNGEHLLSAGWDGTVRLWDLTTQQAITLTAHSGKVSDAKFSPNGEMFATASADDKTMLLWDAKSLTITVAISDTPANQINFSADSKSLAIAGVKGAILVIDTSNGSKKLEKQEEQALTSVAFSPDGKYVASAGFEGVGTIWEVATGNVVSTLKGHNKAIYAIVYSVKGDLVATASDDGTARLWDAATGAIRFVLQGHTAGVLDVAFRPDGLQLATAGVDGTLRLWSSKTGRLEAILPDSKGVENLVSWGLEDSQIVGLGYYFNSILDVNYDWSGTRVVAAGTDGSVTIYVAPVEMLLKLANTQITRDFTCQERVQFLVAKLDCPTAEPTATSSN